MDNDSRVLRGRGFRWEGVAVEDYGAGGGGGFRRVGRQVLLGEGEGESALNFITRYFELEPGGYSALERHRHAHAVVVVRGTGKVILGEQVHAIGPMDCVYVAPDSLHQFHATGTEPLGFLCMVDRERFPSEPAREEELAALAADPEGAELLKRLE
jgi:quercetin dioxygenase-like cupin family protein